MSERFSQPPRSSAITLSVLAGLGLIALGLAAVPAGPALAQTAPAAASSATLHIGGTVATRCTVAVTDNQTSLNLTQGQTTAPVAAVTEQCNAGDGYTVTVTSTNGGQLRSDAPGSVPVSYSMAYDSTAAGKGGTLTADRTAPSTTARQSLLTISTPANAQLAAGTYQDTLTVAITAK